MNKIIKKPEEINGQQVLAIWVNNTFRENVTITPEMTMEKAKEYADKKYSKRNGYKY